MYPIFSKNNFECDLFDFDITLSNDNLEIVNGDVIAKKEGAITLRMKTTFTKANIEYDVYSSPITITVGDANSQTSQNPTIGENINNSGCNGSIAEQTIIFTPVLLCVYIGAILKKKVKDNG